MVTDNTTCRICLYLKDRGDERCAGVDAGPRVVREQGPVTVIQSNIALVHAVNGADKGGDDDEDPDDGEDPEEDDHGDGEAESGPGGLAARRPLLRSVQALDVEGVHIVVHVPRVPLLGGALGHVDAVHNGDKSQPLSQNGGKKSMVLNKISIGKI